MLKNIEEFGKYVGLTGFRDVELKDIELLLEKVRKEKKPDVEVQFFDAHHIATLKHLYFAVLNALTAFKNGKTISKSLAMEIMLYASAQHQIQRAMDMLKIKPSLSEIAVLVVAEKAEDVNDALSMIARLVNAKPDEKVLELSANKRACIQKAFNISDVEIEAVMKKGQLEEALVDLVIERMALLATRK